MNTVVWVLKDAREFDRVDSFINIGALGKLNWMIFIWILLLIL